MFERLLFFLGGLFLSVIEKTGYLGVFIMMTLDSCAIPIPSEAVLSFSGFQVSLGVFRFAPLLFVALLGNAAGYSLLYFIGKKLRNLVYRNRLIASLLSPEKIAKGEAFVKRRGGTAVFFGTMIPLVRAYISLPSGMLQMPYKRFLKFALAGSLFWNTVWISAGVTLGNNWAFAEQYARKYALVILLVGFGLFLWYIKNKFGSKHNTMKIIIANWKMNPATAEDAHNLALFVDERISRSPAGTAVVLCPPHIFLADLIKRHPGVAFGAQDCFWEGKGPYTGEVSPEMLKSIGCQYVILGHSERRKHMNETDEMINKKILRAIAAGLSVIFCVGEQTREGVAQKDYFAFIEQQLKKGLAGVSEDQLDQVLVAYEPVWAISNGVSGTSDTPQNAATSMAFIRKVLQTLYKGSAVQKMAVLYGGSVNAANAEGFLKERSIGGALVGGASLRKEEFGAILAAADKYH
jgi:triosephosphate isomerase